MYKEKITADIKYKIVPRLKSSCPHAILKL
jgi:hypothetical protein